MDFYSCIKTFTQNKLTDRGKTNTFIGRDHIN